MIIKIERHERNFAQIDNKLLQDKRLSLKAKGLMAYLLGHTKDWQVQVMDIVNHSTDGRDAVYAGLNELRKLGYATLSRELLSNGRVHAWEWTVHEIPKEIPDTDSPDTENPVLEKPDITNRKGTKRERNMVDAGTRVARPAASTGVSFGIKAKKTKSSILCERFYRLVVEKNHLNRIKLKNGETCTIAPKMGNWVLLCKGMRKAQNISFDEMNETIIWYSKNIRNKYIGTYASMPKFLENYQKIRKAMPESDANTQPKLNVIVTKVNENCEVPE